MDLLFWNPWAAVTLAALAMLIVSVVGDHRRRKRRDLDRAGFMPWPLITVMSGVLVLFGAALAIQLG